MKVQRITVTFACSDVQKYITHLDLMRVWERVFTRAKLPVSYSEGFSPRPHIALAAPLAVGVTSDCELLDVFLKEKRTLDHFAKVITPQLPSGLRLINLHETPLTLASLQSLLRSVEYHVDIEDSRHIEELRMEITALLAKDELLWEQQRIDGVRRYDIRALILDLNVSTLDRDCVRIVMKLRSDAKGSGRPEQVAAALGFASPPLRIHRTQINTEQPEITVAASQLTDQYK